MKRDVITTTGGLVVVALVVVATFLYGSQQRQAQVKHDQGVKQAQTQEQKPNTQSTADNQQGSKPQLQPGSTPAQPLQGGQSAKKQPATGAATVAPVAKPVVATSTTPKTGGELFDAVGLVAIVLLYRYYRSSKRSLKLAALSV